jgi:hypothetical protein
MTSEIPNIRKKDRMYTYMLLSQKRFKSHQHLIGWWIRSEMYQLPETKLLASQLCQ